MDSIGYTEINRVHETRYTISNYNWLQHDLYRLHVDVVRVSDGAIIEREYQWCDEDGIRALVKQIAPLQYWLTGLHRQTTADRCKRFLSNKFHLPGQYE